MIPLNRIQEVVAAKGDQAAIVAGATTLSWREFAASVSSFLDVLGGLTHRGDLHTVCVISANRPELLVAAAAAATLRLTYCGLDYSLDQEVLAQLVEDAEADCVIVSSMFLTGRGIDPLRVAGRRPILDLDGRLPGRAGRSPASDPASAPPPVPSSRQFRSLSFTSGTTGKPKPVLRTASFDARRFAYFTSRYSFSAADRHLVTIPLYHAAGNGWARLFLSLGATVVLAPPDDPVAAADLIRSEWITTTAVTPPILGAMLRHVADDGGRVTPNQMRFMLVGGKHFPTTLKNEAMCVFGPVVHEYYGTTETGVNTIAEPADLITHPSSVGRAYDGNRILVLDQNHAPLPPGLVGTIAVSSYMNMDGYVSAVAHRTMHGGDRYLVTSESGYLDEDGRLYLMNRSQGVNTLNLYALETMVRQIRGVRDAALLPIGSGASVDCAVVVQREGGPAAAATEAQVRAVLQRERVALRRFAMLPSIPYSPSGKVRAKELEAALDEGGAAPRKIAAPPARPPAPARSAWVGAALLTVTAVSWGGMFPVAKSALSAMDGYYLTLFRYGLASIILMAILAAREGVRALWPGRQVWALFAFGSLGFAGFSILAFVGLAHSKAEHGAIIMALMPLITVLLTWALKGKAPGQVALWCIAAALAGVGLVVTRGDLSSLQGGSLLPDLAILVGAVCWVAYTIGSGYVPGWSALRYTAVTAALGTITIMAITAAVTAAGVVTVPRASTILSVAPQIAYLVLIAAVLAVFTWNIGIGILGPTNGVLFINLVPLTAFAIAMARGQAFGPLELAGAALTVLALIANNLNSRGLFRLPAVRRAAEA